MRKYKKYLDNPNSGIPKTSVYNQRTQALDIDDSSEVEQWRTLANEDCERDGQVAHVSNSDQEVLCRNEIWNLEKFSSSPTASENNHNNLPANQSVHSGLHFHNDATTVDEHESFHSINGPEDFNHTWEADLIIEEFVDADDDDYWYANDELLVEEQIENNVPFTNPLQKLLQDNLMNERLDVPITVSRAEILLAVLKFSLVYNLPQTAIADLLKMLNTFFIRPILKDSRYHIDKIFNCNNTVDYHFLCKKCKQYVKKSEKKIETNLICNVCETEFSVKDPTYTDFFTIIDSSTEIAHLIEQNYEYYENVTRNVEQNNIQDINTGGLYRLLKNSLPENKRENFVTASFNSDGAPVFESLAFSIWPIQLVINELPYDVRSSKPIVVGLWFGKHKPNMEIFLDPFIAQMNKLANEGFVCNTPNNGVRRIFLYCICCCVDSEARALMQGIKKGNGYYGCSWCLHPGYYVSHGKGGCVKYILLDEPVQPRTEATMLRHAEDSISQGQPVFGIKYLTVLNNLVGFKLISGFVPDAMHFIDLGIGTQFLKYWIESSRKPYSLTSADIDKIDSILTKVKAPKKITRFTRSIRDRSNWKAREWQNWVLFYSMAILMSFPHLQIYAKHWNLLVKSYFILLQDTISKEELQEADEMLKKFVVYTEFYYSKSAMTYNLHQLLHVCESVSNWGALWAHSGYFFESGNGQIVKKVHAAKGVLQQICRIIAMNKNEIILRNHIALNEDSPVLTFVKYLDKKDATSVFKLINLRYFGPDYPVPDMWIQRLNLSHQSRIHRRVVKNKCLFASYRNTTLRSDNSLAFTRDGNFIRIIEFIVDPENNKEFIICHPINTEEILYDNDTSFMKKIINISNASVPIETHVIDKVCVQISVDNTTSFISPVPNSFSY